MAREIPESLFDKAAAVFGGWTDPESGLRVLRIQTRGPDEKAPVWSTPYHQLPCFLEGGRKVVLNGASPRGGRAGVLDLTTGTVEDPFPPDYSVTEVNDRTGMATLRSAVGKRTRACVWDMNARHEVVATVSEEGWNLGSIHLVSDGRRAVVFLYRGNPYSEPVHSRYLLLEPEGPSRTILDVPRHYCSHYQSCPTDPNLFAYDRWPSPPHDLEQAIHIRTLEGSFEEPLKLLPDTIRPIGALHGARDHYLWTPDGRWIVSYLYPHPLPRQETFNHLEFEWWLSATDWRSGEDHSARYPQARWGGHMGVSPDSKQILCAGGPGFDKLFMVSIDALKHGWNERILCTYPKTVSKGTNSDPYPHPFALPDQSGVIFNAGWPGPEHGVYLVEWPKNL